MSASIEAKLLVIIDKLKIIEQRIEILDSLLRENTKKQQTSEVLIQDLEEEVILFEPKRSN